MVCKLVTAASATLIALPLLSAAAPVVEKRAGITCQKKFAGHLYAYTLSGQPQQNLTVTFDSESFLKVDYTAKAQPVYTQFDECWTEGWNKDGYMYGQLKPIGADFQRTPHCFTGVTPGSEPTEINVQACSSSNDAFLNQQWWMANWTPTNIFTVRLTGNPNDGSQALRNNVIVDDAGRVQEKTEDGEDVIELQFANIEYY